MIQRLFKSTIFGLESLNRFVIDFLTLNNPFVCKDPSPIKKYSNSEEVHPDSIYSDVRNNSFSGEFYHNCFHSQNWVTSL
jgi:hypothetical protein